MFLDNFIKKKPKVESPLDVEINRCYSLMAASDPSSNEYKVYQERLKELYEIKGKKPEKKPLVPKEVQGPLVGGVFTLLAIAFTKKLELDGPITSKSWTFIPKWRG